MNPKEQAMECCSLSLNLNGRQILTSLNLRFEPGERVGILGPNGAGKSSLLRCIVGLEQRHGGAVRMNDIDLSKKDSGERVREGLGYLAQEPWVFPELNPAGNLKAVAELLEIPAELHTGRIESALDEYGLRECAKTRAEFLSGGEKRRLELARVSLLEPKFLLLDEPFANLDPVAANDLNRRLSALSARGTALILCDHHAERIRNISSRIIVLDSGKLLADGSVEDIWSHGEVSRRYFGE